VASKLNIRKLGTSVACTLNAVSAEVIFLIFSHAISLAEVVSSALAVRTRFFVSHLVKSCFNDFLEIWRGVAFFLCELALMALE